MSDPPDIPSVSGQWMKIDDLRLTNSLTTVHNSLGGGSIGQIVSARRYMSDSSGQPEDVWYSYDVLGNVANLSDATGAKTEEYNQDAFGNVLADVNTGEWAATFTGRHLTAKEFDSLSSLYYYNKRWYDPIVGRFIQRGSPYTLADNKPQQTAKDERKAIEECFEETKDEANEGRKGCGNFADKLCGGEGGSGLLSQCLDQKGITLNHCTISYSWLIGPFHIECSVNCGDGGYCRFGDVDIWFIEFPAPYGGCTDPDPNPLPYPLPPYTTPVP